MPTIILADDHPVVRQGLRSLLEAEPDFQVIAEAGDGMEATRLAESLKPDVLVLDLMMPRVSGLEVTRQVRKSLPGTAVVILSMYGSESYVHEALAAGAKAYVLKESSSDELVRAVRQAIAGHRYLSPPLSEKAIEAFLQNVGSTEVNPYNTLTVREREVLQLAAQGFTNADIATRLYISRRTVEVHRAHMMEKLGLHTQTDLIRYALQRGILVPEK